MQITDLIHEGLILPQLRSKSGPEVLRELAGLMAERHPGVDAEQLFRALHEREQRGSTALERGVAVPHGKMPGIPGVLACLGLSRSGIAFGSPEGGRSHLFFALVAPESAAGAHLKALARISRLFQDPGLGPRLLKAESAEEIRLILTTEEAKFSGAPTGGPDL